MVADEGVNYEQIIRKTPHGVITTDGAFRIRYINSAVERLTGVREDEVIGQNFFDIFSSMRVHAGNMEESSLVRVEIDGRSISIRNFHINEYAENGATETTYVFIMSDVSGLLSLTSELERLEQLSHELQEIIESSFDGILVTDGDANVLMVNQSYVRNTDIRKAELIGHNMRELINPV
ncbi:MAG: PAS domain-containing protein, partial [Clostridiales Family XIII bacterium]|nr:PAS domain-containing protein [Clostridiales Family XIII bacterium]